MRRLRHVAALAGSASIILGAVALASPASAAPLSPHPRPAAVPHDFNTDTVTGLSLSASSVAFDHEPGLKANFLVRFKNCATLGCIPPPVSGGLADLRRVLADGTQVDLCSNVSIGSNGTGSCNLTAEELPPGSYQVIGHYEGVLHVANHSDSGPAALSVTRAATTAQLTAVPQVAFGQESAEDFGVTVTSGTSAAPTGNFTVALASDAALCSGQLASGIGRCSPAGDRLDPGTYQVRALYLDDSTNSPSTSTFQTVTVTKGAAVTTLSLGPSRIGFGQQQNEQLTVHVAPVGAGTPAGQVTVREGNANICGATLANGVATCQLTPGQLAVGRHPLTASYSGDTRFDGTTSTPQTLTVTAPTTTALSLSRARVKFGSEQAERLTVTVKSTISGTGTPGGTVTITAGNNTICRAITLHSGKASCTLTARKLRPGTYHLTARYAGATLFTSSTSPRKTLTVTR